MQIYPDTVVRNVFGMETLSTVLHSYIYTGLNFSVLYFRQKVYRLETLVQSTFSHDFGKLLVIFLVVMSVLTVFGLTDFAYK